MRYIDSVFNFEKVANNVDSAEFMLTSMAGYYYYPINGRVIEAILCLLKKKWVAGNPDSLAIVLQLKDVKSYSFNQQVTQIDIVALTATEDVAYGIIQGTSDQVILLKQSPTKFALLLLSECADPAQKIAERFIQGNKELMEELTLLKQQASEVPNIFDAYTEVNF